MGSFTEADLKESIVTRFERQVAECSDRVAVRCEGVTLTYSELNRAANRLARAILATCGKGEQVAALLLDHGAPVVTGIFAAAKAGKIYLCLNPDDPPTRIAAILDDCGAAVVVTQSSRLILAKEACAKGVPILCADEVGTDLDDGNLGLDIRPGGGPSGLFYTSASTGAPKGVLTTQANDMHSAFLARNLKGLGDGDRLGLHFFIGFAYARVALFGALLNGLPLHLFRAKAEGMGRMVQWVRDEEITYLAMTPSAFREFAGALPDGLNLPKLRRISIGGETVRRSDIELARGRLSKDCVMVHEYGQTETGTPMACLLDCRAGLPDEVLPLGACTFGTEAFIMDEEGRPVRAGQVGELVIRSRYISAGYWRRPDLTARHFTQDPADPAVRTYRSGDLALQRPDGVIVHKGRKDSMSKIRGQRVEIEEIETALARVPGVAKGAVAVRPDARGENRLIAYVVPAGTEPLAVSQLRTELRKSLPDYMVPSVFTFLGALPLNPHGKVDRKALAAIVQTPLSPGRDGPADAPRGAIERELTRMWQALFNLPEVGVQDNFFDLGGHSLLAARLLASIEELFGAKLSPAALIEAPTIAELARAVSVVNEGATPDHEKPSVPGLVWAGSLE